MGILARWLRRHWAAGALVLVPWGAFWAWLLLAPAVGLAPVAAHPAVPLLAGIAVACRSPSPRGPGLGAATALGAGIAVLDGALMVALAWQGGAAALPLRGYATLVLTAIVGPGATAGFAGYLLAAPFVRAWRAWRGGL